MIGFSTAFSRTGAGHGPAPATTCAALIAAALAGLPAATARAGESAPAAISGGDVRLLGGMVKDGIADAGIEMRLGSGWKTYWRYPGDSGVPPRIDWAGSVNIAEVSVDFPAPRRFSDGAGGFSIGYKGTVLLPLKVRLADPGKPARLNLVLDFAVCEALCTLAQAELMLVLNGPPDDAGQARADADAQARIAAARALVPKPAAVAADAADGPAVLSVSVESSARPARLIVETRAASPKADLFVEGPDAGWALPLPQKTALPDGRARFVLPLDGLPPDTRAEGSLLTLTLVDPPRAVAVQAQVPAAAP